MALLIIKIQAQAKKQIGTSPEYYRLQVDLKRGTYKTIKLPIDEFQNPQDKSVSGKNPHFSTPTLNATADTSITANTPGYFSADVQLKTEDPIQLGLAKTANILKWNVYSSGTVEWDTWAYTTWAANPSELNTHWYLDWDDHAGPWYENYNTEVYHDVEAQYYNYDFLDDNDATYVRHWIKIRGQNDGWFTYWYDTSY
ncbi:MAG: hypothetical protein ACOY9Y_12195 [Bacillota bacterium]